MDNQVEIQESQVESQKEVGAEKVEKEEGKISPFEKIKKKLFQKAVFVVTLNRIFIGCYATFDETFSNISKELSEDYIRDCCEFDEETTINEDDIAQLFDDNPYNIIPVLGLDRNKPIYVTMSGNYLYKTISNVSPSDEKEHYLVFNFSTS